MLANQLAAARAVHRRFHALLDPWIPGTPPPAELELVAHQLHHYDGPAYAGRPVGEAGPYGLATRSETLVFDGARLQRAYGSRRPAALGGQAVPPAPAPSATAADMGYRLRTPSAARYLAGYYTDTQRQRFDVHDPALPAGHRRGVRTGLQDALGHETTIEPDDYWVLPTRVVDAAALELTAAYDYATMQPARVTDPNGNAALAAFSPLGLVTRMWLEGRNGEGGTRDEPETRFEHDLTAVVRTAGACASRNRPLSPRAAAPGTRTRAWRATYSSCASSTTASAA